MGHKPKTNLDRLFYPRSIAVVGASPKKDKGWNSGNAYIAGFGRQGFTGKVYPVHPTADSILGYQVYKSVLDIPDQIDLAIFTVRAQVALEVLKDCAVKGVRFVHFLTAGFSETGREEHAGLEARLVDIARQGGIRFVGPNCMGVYCPDSGLSWNGWLPRKSGDVSVLSQSGQLATTLISEARWQNVGFSKVVSIGNGSDLKATDYLTYFAQDDKTAVIGAYLEGLIDGRDFFEAARELDKPLVVWKGGRTQGGARATLSHTAAIAGSPGV